MFTYLRFEMIILWQLSSSTLSYSLTFSFRGEVSSSAYGVLPASLNLRHDGNQRGPQVGHQHQEADTAQHHLVQLRLKHTGLDWTGLQPPVLSGFTLHTYNCANEWVLCDPKGHFFKVQWAMIFFLICFLIIALKPFCAAISLHILTVISADLVHSGC